MSKIYKGWELIQAIADGEIKNGSRLKFTNQQNGTNITVTVGKDCSGKFVLKNENTDNSLYANWLINTDIELIEDEINIDRIEELNDTYYDVNTMSDDDLEFYHNKTRATINEILQAVKQIDKRVKKLEEE